jgi:GT2 family glycosyltransferase
VVSGGKTAAARNNGAKKCKGDLLFVDSDVVFEKGFLEEFLGRIKKDNADYATCFVKPMTDKSWIKACYFIKNWGNYFADRIRYSHVSGQCLYVRRALFDLAKGYDETLFLGEEHEFAARLKKIGKGKFYTDIFVWNSPRRLEKEGIRSFLKDIYSEIIRLKGPLRKEIYERKYGHY